jgi:hypothetical protein
MARNPPQTGTKLFMSELMVIPEPPHRVGEKDRYYFKQHPERQNNNSKMMKYYTHTLPPHKINPYEQQPKSLQDFAAVTKAKYTLNPSDTYDRNILFQQTSARAVTAARGNRLITLEKSTRPQTVPDLNASLKQAVTGFNVTKEDPKLRFDNRKALTSHDYGWNSTLELNKVGSRNIFQNHAKKSMVFD